MSTALRYATVCLILLAPGCAGVQKRSTAPASSSAEARLYLVSHNNWHSGLVMRRKDVPDDRWPEKDDFGACDLIEVGWGDRDYYMAERATSGLAVKAALLPTASVLHVMGAKGLPQQCFPHSRIIEFEVGRDAVAEACRFIEGYYDRDKRGRSVCLGKGLYGGSRFYSANGKFWLFNTCNTWTARGLRAAGIPVSGFMLITAASLQKRALKHGTPIN